MRILDKLCPEDRPDIEGDFLEVYEYRSETNRSKANLRLLTECLTLLPLALKRNQSQTSNNSIIMFKTHLKVARRNLAKNKLYSFINVLGLTLGLTATLLIAIFVKFELSYDKHYPDHENVYRIVGSYNQGGDSRTEAAQTSYLLAPFIFPNFPQLGIPVRIDFYQDMITIGENQYLESNILLADSTFFQIFQKNFIAGSPKGLSNPNNVILTASTAQKYFEEKNAIGKTIELRDESFQVAAVIEDFPVNSHYTADIILPMHGVMKWYPKWVTTNSTGTSHYTYFKTSETFNLEATQNSVNQYIVDNYDNAVPPEFTFQSLASIHLNSNLSSEIEANGSINTVYIFSATALIILILACVNYINLSLAGSLQRSKEVGVKRVLGASKSSQITQFQIESTLVVGFSAILAVLFTWLSIPFFNQLTGQALSFNPLAMLDISTGLIFLLVVIGKGTGSFPSFLLLKMSNSEALSGKFTKTTNGGFLQNLLVVFQFAIAVTLIASTFIVLDQMTFLKGKNLGLQKENLIIIPFQTGEIRNRYQLMKSELSRSSSILGITASNNNITNRVGNWRPYLKQGAEESVTCPTVIVAHDFFEVMGTTLVDGRTFSKEFPGDLTEAFVINESAAKFFEMENPVGSPLLGNSFTGSEWSQKKAQVIGVVKDFHFASLHSEVRPVVFSLHGDMTVGINWMKVRIKGENIGETLTLIEDTWNEINPERPFTFEFMEDEIQAHYEAEDRFLKVFGTFSVLSILLGAIGLFGLTAFLMERRTKEIGIRKIMGASIPALVGILSRKFLVLVLLSTLIGGPIAFYLMQEWLQDFAYQVEISPLTFVLTGLTAMLIAFLAIVFHSLKISIANPVNSLRCE